MRIGLMCIIFSLSLVSCVIKPQPINTPIPNIVEVELTPFPLYPALKAYTRQPIIDSQDNNFIVSDEFVENSVLLKKYYDRVVSWKEKNKIK